MHGTRNIKFANAQQAKIIYNYKNIKEKLHKVNAFIWFNKNHILYIWMQIAVAVL
jgi:hypothetical protein